MEKLEFPTMMLSSRCHKTDDVSQGDTWGTSLYRCERTLLADELGN